MNTPFRLDQYPRRAGQPLSSPPPGYFERLPTQVMSRVRVPARPMPLAWLLHAPAALRTGLASTLLLATFAASLWLGHDLSPASELAEPLSQVSKAEMLDYLTSGETRVDLLDLAELPVSHAALTRQYLRPSANELTQALDELPASGDAPLL